MTFLQRIWLRWKSLRLPWRKTYLVGHDLLGNTYWEFKDAINHNRLRRIVRYPPRTHHADVHVSPLWHQWLRHTRHDPPSLHEQSADVTREAQLKHNALLADARWAAKAKYIERPRTQQPKTNGQMDQVMDGSGGRSREDPWAKAKETAVDPGSNWKPDAWVPGAAKR